MRLSTGAPLTVLFGLLVAAATPCQDRPEVAPYPALRYRDDLPQVRHERRWYALEAIEGVQVEKILDHARKTFGPLWKKRFAEDLVRVMDGMGERPGAVVDLSLRDLETGKAFIAEDVPMTQDNRRGVRETWENDGEPRRAAVRPRRDLANGPRAAVFRAMREADGRIEVQVDDDKWYEWRKLDGIEAGAIHAWCEANAGSPWKRITEDLPAVLMAMGHDLGREAELELRDLATGRVVTMEDVEWSGEKRRRLLQANKRREGAADLLRGLAGGDAPALLAAEAVAADLAQLRELLDTRFSYRHMLGVDLDALLGDARERLGDGQVRAGAFAREVARVLRAFGDGHAGVRGGADRPESGYLPFLLAYANGGVVAFRPDRTGLVDPEHPYLVEMDGVPVARWLEASEGLVNRGSPQYLRRGAVRGLRYVQQARGVLGIGKGDALEIVLADADGGTVQRTLEVASRYPTYGPWPRGSTRLLADGEIGYLRIPSMDWGPEVAEAVDAAMARFRETEGLIIDVRGNGGGSRGTLRHLFPYFMGAGDPPRVANIAAYRLPKGEGDPHRPDGWLDDRWLYPANCPRWSEDARDAIVKAARAFRPGWDLPAGDFSGWHYMVLERDANPKAYHYDEPVVVLMDGGCFSATDVFLGALKGWPGITLMGTPSGGGSGRTRTYRLENSGLRLRLSSMASFQPDGTPYDGHGVQPDVVLQPEPGFFIGESDRVLEAALKRLKG